MLNVKIQRLPNGQLVITLPRDLAEIKEWDKGTVLSFKNFDETSVIISSNKNVKKKGNEK